MNPFALETSLENHQRFPMTCCRPSFAARKEESAELRIDRLRWAELAPTRGDFSFAGLTLREGNGTALLAPTLLPPAWAEIKEDAVPFIRLLGAAMDGGKGYAGVLLDTGGLAGNALIPLLRAWHEGFDNTALIVRAADTATVAALRCAGYDFGLLLEADKGILSIRELLATQRLQRCWERMPVFLLTTYSREPKEALSKAAAGWHALAADIPCVNAGHMTLRRLTYPAQLTSGGAMPLRFWWQVVGACPIYGQTSVRVLLRGDGGEAELPLQDTALLRGIGDATHNEIVTLPSLPVGQYTLWCGVFGQAGKALPLCVDAPQENGFYAIGEVSLDDTPRPELFAAWDDYYPEGYYPLEDPKLPY